MASQKSSVLMNWNVHTNIGIWYFQMANPETQTSQCGRGFRQIEQRWLSKMCDEWPWEEVTRRLALSLTWTIKKQGLWGSPSKTAEVPEHRPWYRAWSVGRWETETQSCSRTQLSFYLQTMSAPWFWHCLRCLVSEQAFQTAWQFWMHTS